MSDRIHVLIVEDNRPDAREMYNGLRKYEEFKVEVRFEADKAVEDVKDFEAANRHDPDAVMVVLMDVTLRGSAINGLVATRRIYCHMRRARRLGSQATVKVLIITQSANRSNAHIINAFDVGASGCVSKGYLFDPTAPSPRSNDSAASLDLPTNLEKVLVPAIKEVAAGGEVWAGLLGDRETDERISDREWEAALHVARGLHDNEIAARMGIETSTVKAHLKSFRDKRKLDNRTEIAWHLRENEIFDLVDLEECNDLEARATMAPQAPPN